MAKYRYGYKNAWKVKAARERMLQLGFKAPGSYGRKGVMPSMPNQVLGILPPFQYSILGHHIGTESIGKRVSGPN